MPSNDDSSLIANKYRCPKIVEIQPMNVSLQAPVDTELTLTFNFLPSPTDDGIFRCLFENSAVLAEYVDAKTLKCHLPSFDERPKKSIDDDSDIDQKQLRLKIWSSVSGAVFYETPFLFYDCGAHKRLVDLFFVISD